MRSAAAQCLVERRHSRDQRGDIVLAACLQKPGALGAQDPDRVATLPHHAVEQQCISASVLVKACSTSSDSFSDSDW